jgi:hypothetical protein
MRDAQETPVVKTFVLHHLPDMDDLPAAERWFYRYHIPEVLRNRPLSYVSFRAVPAPEGAEAYGYFNYKVHENLAVGDEEPPLGLLGMSHEVVPLNVVMVTVPVVPTEDFLGRETPFDERTILRWFCVHRYPGGVSVEEGDEWFREVHAPEVLRQPGLTRFFSYRVMPPRFAIRGSRPLFLHPRSTFSSDWHRVSELWYEDARGWRESVLAAPPAYTPPPWATRETYPFLAPGAGFVSTFLLERPADDWLRDVRPLYL